MASPHVRVIDAAELGSWLGIAERSMHAPLPDADAVERRRASTEVDRCHAAVDEAGTLCGTAGAFTTELTVPGGTAVPTAAVTMVGVLPTHRRQGHLGRMMRAQLDDIAGRGEPLAALVAAEHPIYGRFGYGPATEACTVRIDRVALTGHPHGGWTSPPTGTVELVGNDTFAAALGEVYEAARRRTPGHIRWRPGDHRAVAGLEPPPFGPDTRTWPKVLWRDPGGRVRGAAVYSVTDRWDHNRPRATLSAVPVVAATDEAERELVRYLTSVDWVGTVDVGLRPVDDPTPLQLHDGRSAVLVDRSDHVWVRVMDLPAALAARSYQTSGRLVLEVEDPMGLAGGRVALEADGEAGDLPGGGHPAVCTPTGAAPDLTVPVSALGAAYLGGTGWARLAAAGLLDEHRPGAAARAAAMFGTPRAPWCAMTF